MRTKKIVLFSALVAVAAGASVYSASSSPDTPELTELQAANIEAIAASGGTVEIPFYCVGNEKKNCIIGGVTYLGIKRNPQPPRPYPGPGIEDENPPLQLEEPCK